MTASLSFFRRPRSVGGLPQAAIFLSGSGSNAERVLRRWQAAGSNAPFKPVALVTDSPESSRASELAAAFDLPLVENDIRAFYRERGETRFSIATARGREIRADWTNSLRRQLADFEINFGILAGFMPLTNLTGDFPCLNVHPGDLTYEKDGRRWLVGLHTVPIERAILEGLETLRSSVIVAQPYEGGGDNMDSGPILGLSQPVPVNLLGYTVGDLGQCASRRPLRRPAGGYADQLEEVAMHNLENLKIHGDWQVLPGAVFDFASDRFALDSESGLLFRLGPALHPVQTVVYGEEGREVIFR